MEYVHHDNNFILRKQHIFHGNFVLYYSVVVTEHTEF